ncbi:MAG: esterase family protein [Planctomycetes bacterium]|nr:esterase family protein [Planctomycetota bacterium]
MTPARSLYWRVSGRYKTGASAIAPETPIDQIVERLEKEGNAAFDDLARSRPVPVVQDREVLFVFRDHRQAVRSVQLVHHVVGLHRSPRFDRVSNNGLFILHLVLPNAARLEYTFRVVGKDGSQQIITDPANPKAAFCPFGPKSVVETAGYVDPPWVRFQPGIERGSIEEHSLKTRHFPRERAVTLYRPAGEPPADGWPLLIVHDGGDYRHFSDLVQVLDNLIASKQMAPVFAALTHPGDRNWEYPCTEEHPAFVVEDLIPFVRANHPVSQDRRRVGVMGASFGAVASAFAAYRYPQVFGLLLLQSGSFLFNRLYGVQSRYRSQDEFGRIRRFLETEFFPKGPALPCRFYISCGTFEGISGYSREVAQLMSDAGHEVHYRETHDGHNWVCWRDTLGEAFPYLFPPASPSN